MNIKSLLVSALALLAGTTGGSAQSFKDNWYVQAGLDMSLQVPYSYGLRETFPNGKTFGVDVAVGKWFTPELGLRAKLNWDNGIRLFENDHANWLAPFFEPGVNMDKGGYVYFVGDIQFDLHNIFRGYDKDRKWNAQVFPRAGFAYNFGVAKGTPLLGLGLGNTYALNNRLKLYGDVAYNMVSSGFTGHSSTSTGYGTNSNGFITIDVGVQVNIGNSGFEEEQAKKTSFFDHCYAQLGLDMSLQNPYRCNFSEVFPKGKTFGLAAGLGKWFSPEIGLRLRTKWENGFKPFRNDHLEWMAPFGKPNTNMDDGGYIELSCDVELSMHNIIAGYDSERKWNAVVFPRAGLVSNLSTSSASPLIGGGAGVIRKLNDKWSVFGDMAYQVTTSEFFSPGSWTGMSVSTGCNGFFDFHVGVQYDF